MIHGNETWDLFNSRELKEIYYTVCEDELLRKSVYHAVSCIEVGAFASSAVLIMVRRMYFKR